ncbi:MAG TPA: class I SAM-dependent methyltransferase [Tepidisphaeraceae bacterium]|jgi:predicted O-methyltransferase YrrM|nr:class I SAM-dependent methyltransferase [Tepidisphaeraceae bacterium]
MIPMTPALAAQIDETERLAQPRGDSMQISRDVGHLLANIALAHQAKLIVEVGTSYGFSGMWWSALLATCNGHLHTIDVLDKKYSTAKATFAAAGLADRVTSHLGNAREIIPTIPGVIDVAFIDADKPSTQAYFDLLWLKLRVGGAIVTDNVISHPQEMEAYLTALRARDDAHTVTIPMRAGVEWTVKLR